MRLKGRTILITGGSSGIGLELARQLLARENTVIITGRDQGRIDAALTTLPGAHGYQSDAAAPHEIQQLGATITVAHPTLDVVINSAGIMRKIKLYADDATDVGQEIDVDLSGPILMVQQFLPHLLLQPSALIVNVTSGLAFVPIAISPIYSAAKAGLHAYTRCLREQLRRTAVRVVDLVPPLTDTPLLSHEFVGDMPTGSGMAVTALVAHAIAGIEAGKQEIRPGQSNFLKIAIRVAPGFMFAQLAKVGQPQRPPA